MTSDSSTTRECAMGTTLSAIGASAIGAQVPGGPAGEQRQIEKALNTGRVRTGGSNRVHAMCGGRHDSRVALQPGRHALWLPSLDRHKGVGISAHFNLIALAGGPE